jgi:hypothetical protein
MTKWLYWTGLANYHENQRRQQQQFEIVSRMESVHPINPSSYESVTHRVNDTGGIQINHKENGTQVIAGSRHAYAESVAESSVTEGFEDDAATENSGCETKDTDDAISDRKKSGQRREKSTSPPSPVFTDPQCRASTRIQNNNTGNGTQFVTFSSQGNVYNFNSGTGSQIRNAEFHGDVYFGPNNEITIRNNHRGKGAQSSTYSTTYQLGPGCQIQDAHFHGNAYL